MTAENIYSQVLEDDTELVSLDEIVDHQKDRSAVLKDNMYIHSYNGTYQKRQATQGWQLLVR
jgi:hypothetical protein